AALARRLDRMTRQVERLERDLTISAEALALFIRFWLTITPPLPDSAQTAHWQKDANVSNRSSRPWVDASKGQSLLRRSRSTKATIPPAARRGTAMKRKPSDAAPITWHATRARHASGRKQASHGLQISDCTRRVTMAKKTNAKGFGPPHRCGEPSGSQDQTSPLEASGPSNEFNDCGAKEL